MKKISKEEIEYLAKLSRVGLTEKEIEKYKSEIGKILDYFEKLNELNVEDIKPTAQVVGLLNIMREDEIKKSELSQEELLRNAINKENGFIKVKPIL